MKTFLGSILIVASVVSAAVPAMAFDRCRTPVVGCEAPAFPSITPVAPTPAATPAATAPAIPSPEAAPAFKDAPDSEESRET